MNQFFAAGAALLVALTLFGLGKKPKRLFEKDFSGNRSIDSPSLVIPSKKLQEKQYEAKSTNLLFHLPKTSQERFLLKQKLNKLIALNPADRLLAVRIASQWGNQSVLPILRRGLRDVDRRVVQSAAEGISKFKGSQKIFSKKKQVRHPLNVSRMR